MDMGHLGHFDETHRTGSTQDGLHADAAHASLATLHRILLLSQTRISVLLRATCSGESVRGNVTKGVSSLSPKRSKRFARQSPPKGSPDRIGKKCKSGSFPDSWYKTHKCHRITNTRIGTKSRCVSLIFVPLTLQLPLKKSPAESPESPSHQGSSEKCARRVGEMHGG